MDEAVYTDPYYNLPQIRIYIHGPGMKHIMESITLRYDNTDDKISIVGVEKRTKVNTDKDPCIVREENPDYDPSMVRQQSALTAHQWHAAILEIDIINKWSVEEQKSRAGSCTGNRGLYKWVVTVVDFCCL